MVQLKTERKQTDSKKRKIVFIRGLLRGNFHWQPFIDHLQVVGKHTQFDFEPIFIELAGCGDRYQELSPTTPQEAIADLRKQIQHFLQKSEKIEICAISLGGMLALHWASLYPQEISKLTIINSSWPGLSPFFERVNLASLFKIFFTSILSSNQTELKILQATCHNLESIARYITAYTDYARKHPVRRVNIIRQLKLATSFSFPARVGCELLFILGKNDRFVSPRCTKALAEFFAGRLQEFENCGHDVTIDQSPELLQCLTFKQRN